MTTATLHFASSVSGNVSSPVSAVGPPNGSFTTDGNNNASWTHRWRFTSLPTERTIGVQTINLRVRKGVNSGNPDITAVRLYRNSVLVSTLSSETQSITSSTPVDLSYTFDGLLLKDLAAIDLEIATSGAGGGPSARNAVEVDAATWVAGLEDPRGTRLKHWNGSSWVEGELRQFVGGAWVAAPLKRHINGNWSIT